jgi:hypothetical protein
VGVWFLGFARLEAVIETQFDHCELTETIKHNKVALRSCSQLKQEVIFYGAAAKGLRGVQKQASRGVGVF